MFPVFIPIGSGSTKITYGQLIITIALAIFICWLVFTLLQWLLPLPTVECLGANPPCPDPTLWEVLKGQWRWISGKRLW